MWSPLQELWQRIRSNGGFVNAHAHFDRAYSVRPSDFAGAVSGSSDGARVEAHLHEKWQLVDAFKRGCDEEKYFGHITAALRAQSEMGVQASLTFVDCDPVAEERAVAAARRARLFAANELGMRLVLACQTLKGVLEPEARKWFELALGSVDIIGGLPGADRGREKEHLDVLLKRGKETKKRVHVHVDQLNLAEERETELLARKTIEWGMEGRVTAVHAISVAAQPREYRKELYRLCLDAGLSFVACPTAWIDSRRSERLQPSHNAITPIDEMIPAGLTVAIGSDNIADVYKPFSDGDMAVELRLLFEANHFYDRDEIVKIATSNGLKVMGAE